MAARPENTFSAVYDTIAALEPQLDRYRPGLGRLFRRCFPNTLETTTELLDDGTTFVFTGDIPAMWLRDSSAQVRPYIPFARNDDSVRRLISGLIARQAHYLCIDPYANAFNKDPNGQGHQDDHTDMTPWTWERKYELDSLCYPVQLCYDYWRATGDTRIFTPELRQAFGRILDVMRIEQQHDHRSPYHFQRDDCYLPSDTLPFSGRGTRTNFTGMVWSGFRPSDDACKFGFLIPANMFAVVILGHLATFADQFYNDRAMAAQAAQLRDEIDFGIQTYGIVHHPVYGRIYAYETDGFGNYNFMDDANVPSLLSIPYLGYQPADHPVYRNTRAFVLSRHNPYYVEGRYASGIGSPHTPLGSVWHIGLLMQALTSSDREEQRALLDMILATTAGMDFMHESFNPDNPATFTREWFAWANSLFGQFILQFVEKGFLE